MGTTNGLQATTIGERVRNAVAMLRSSIMEPKTEGFSRQGYWSSPLIKAVMDGNVRKVEKLVKRRGMDVNKPNDGTGETPLMFAAINSRAEMVAALIRLGAEVNLADGGGRTALMFAARFGRSASASHLLQHSANPKAADSNGITVLMYAAIGGNAELVGELIKAGADPNARDVLGRSALTFARESQDYREPNQQKRLRGTEVERVLVAAGVDPKQKLYFDSGPGYRYGRLEREKEQGLVREVVTGGR